MEESMPQVGPIFRDIRRYYCEFCGICRSKKALITSHILSNHQEELQKREIEEGEKEGKITDNTCQECGMSFKKPAHLEQHMLSHSVERPFVCSVQDCSSSFRRKDHLNRHLLQHKGKLFKCPKEGCDTEFSIHGNISRHVKEMHEEKHGHSSVKEPPEKHVCKEIGCGKEFKYASKLLKHEESHVKLDSSEAFCSDPSCMKPFANADCLRAHIRSCHQYVSCEVCSSKHLKKNIKRHLRTHEELPSGTFKCSVEDCHHSFTTNSNLQQHVKAAHLNLRPFVCSIPGCGMRFAFKHVRDNHEQSFRHVYVEGDLEEFDREFRSRPRGGRKRQYPTIETLMRKRVRPLIQENCGNGKLEAPEYLSWLLSGDDNEEE